MSYSATATETYSAIDVENVVRNFSADLRMIAESSGTWTREKVDSIVEDVGYLAKRKYIKFIDVTLLAGDEEYKAARYIVNENSGELVASRPGGVMWPRVANPKLRLIVQPTEKWTSTPPDRSKLHNPWGDSSEDISHLSLQSSAGRNFTSSAYGFERTDYTK